MATPQTQPATGWDTRAWLIALIGGTACAAISAWFTYPPLTAPVNRAVRIHLLHMGFADFVSMVFGLVCLLALPGVLSGVARRRTFLWGMIPTTSFWVWLTVEDAVEKGWRDVAKDFWSGPLVCLLCLFLSSGPVSLIRYLLRRRKDRQRQAQAAHEAQRLAAAVPQEGVWPPPPNYTP